MVPLVNPTNDPGVGAVVKDKKMPCTPTLALAERFQSDATGPWLTSLSMTERPGNVMSTAVITPLVTSIVSVPENGQVAPLAQEPKSNGKTFWAVPETSNVVTVSAWALGANRKRGIGVQNDRIPPDKSPNNNVDKGIGPSLPTSRIGESANSPLTLA